MILRSATEIFQFWENESSATPIRVFSLSGVLVLFAFHRLLATLIAWHSGQAVALGDCRRSTMNPDVGRLYYFCVVLCVLRRC